MIVYYPSVQFNGIPVYWEVDENQNSTQCQPKCLYAGILTPEDKKALNTYLDRLKGIEIENDVAIIENRKDFSSKNEEIILEPFSAAPSMPLRPSSPSSPPNSSTSSSSSSPSNSSRASMGERNNFVENDNITISKDIFTRLFENNPGNNTAYYQLQKNNIEKIRFLLALKVLSENQWNRLIEGFKSLVLHHLIIQNIEILKEICNKFPPKTLNSVPAKTYLSYAIKIVLEYNSACNKNDLTTKLEKLQEEKDNILILEKNTARKDHAPRKSILEFQIENLMETRYQEEELRVDAVLKLLNIYENPKPVQGKNTLINILNQNEKVMKQRYIDLTMKLKLQLLYHHCIGEFVSNLEVRRTNDFLELDIFINTLYQQLEVPNPDSHTVIKYFYSRCCFNNDTFSLNKGFNSINVTKNNCAYIKLTDLISKWRFNNEDFIKENDINPTKIIEMILDLIETKYQELAISSDRKPSCEIRSLLLSKEIADNINSILISESFKASLTSKPKKFIGFFNKRKEHHHSKEEHPLTNVLSDIIWNEINSSLELALSENNSITPKATTAEAASSSSSVAKSFNYHSGFTK